MNPSARTLGWLLAIYVFLFAVLAINPTDRPTWFVENLTVWIIVAYIFMFVLIYLHTIGGHYTFALVPFGLVTDLLGASRNHYDRLAHFTVGFYAFAIAEYLWKHHLVANRFLLFTYPVFAISTIAMGYELVEWMYARGASPEAALAYLGSQGDLWDAQADMLADTLGAIFATSIFFHCQGLWKRKMSHRVRNA
jgi:putative membrane protein